MVCWTLSLLSVFCRQYNEELDATQVRIRAQVQDIEKKISIREVKEEMAFLTITCI